MPAESPVSLEVTGRTATVYLDRPNSGNRVDERLAAELRDAFDQVERDDTVWVGVLAGRGASFCDGTEFPDPQLLRPTERLRVSDRIASFSKPLVAALNGTALDQGLELALACDFRVAADGARLGLTQTLTGIIPWDGGTQRLPRLIGQGRALEMIMTARTVDAREALALGLVDRVVDRDSVVEEAVGLADTIAQHGPIAARYAKEAVRAGQDLSMAQGMRLEADLNILLQSTEDRAEGIRSFIEKRPPVYRGE
jgi:enoyl-CoA hydratase/carnithine racemase